MGITPLDIQEKEFERAFRGYDMEDVDEFLDQIARDLETLLKENKELKEKVTELEGKNKNYHQMEETMQSAIIIAQKAADEVKQKALRDADTLKYEAEREARRIIEEAHGQSGRILDEHENLVKQAQDFKERFRYFIEQQLSAIDRLDLPQEPSKESAIEEITMQFDKQTDFDPQPEPEQIADAELNGDTDYETEPFDTDLDLDYGLERDLDKDPEF